MFWYFMRYFSLKWCIYVTLKVSESYVNLKLATRQTTAWCLTLDVMFFNVLKTQTRGQTNGRNVINIDTLANVSLSTFVKVG